MNLLSKIGASIGFASILMSGYLMFIIIPMAQIAESKLKTLRESENGWASAEYRELMEIEGLQICFTCGRNCCFIISISSN